MKGLVYEGTRNVTVEEVPEPVLRAGTLLLRPLRVGICFTDKLAYESAAFASYPPGVVLGHEFCAEVVDAADDVEGFAQGDLVAPDPRIYCGDCLHCRSGFEARCTATMGWIGVALWNGALADLTLAPAMNCFKLVPGMTVDDGAAVEPMAYAFRAVRHSGMVNGDNVAVLGLCDYGIGSAQVAARFGGMVAAADPTPLRRASAKRSGVSVTLDATDDLVQEVRAVMPFGADVVFLQAEEYVPRSQHYLREAYEIARVGATIKVVRISGPDILSLADARLASVKELRLSYNGGAFGMESWRGGHDRGDWRSTMEAIGAGVVRPEAMQPIHLSFDDLRSKRDLDAMFAALPSEASKVFVDVGG